MRMRSTFAFAFAALLIALLLASQMAPCARADNPLANNPSPAPPSHPRDASIDDYRQHLQALTTIVEACAKARDTKACDPGLVGPDDRIPVTQPGSTSPASERRLIRYGWLRVLLSKAQDKDAVPEVKPAAPQPAKPDVNPATGPTTEPTTENIRPIKRTTSQLLEDAETRLANDLAQTDHAPEPLPSNTSERAVMKQVLAGRDFRGLQDPTARDSILEKIGGWINKLFENASSLTAKAAWLGRVIVWGFIVAVCVALVWGLIQLERRWRIRLVPDYAAARPRRRLRTRLATLA